MQNCMPEAIEPFPTVQPDLFPILGMSLAVDLEEFPELNWLPDYLHTINALQYDCDRLAQAIQHVTEEGNVSRDCWIENYTKTKNQKQYTYYQLRWLTGDRKPSGQPKVRTKHLSHRAVSEVRAAIVRGQQVEALEKQRRQLEAEIFRLKQLVRGMSKKLMRASSQNLAALQSNHSLMREGHHEQ